MHIVLSALSMLSVVKFVSRKGLVKLQKNCFGSGGIRTRASEETGALNQRLRPLGHATF